MSAVGTTEAKPTGRARRGRYTSAGGFGGHGTAVAQRWAPEPDIDRSPYPHDEQDRDAAALRELMAPVIPSRYLSPEEFARWEMGVEW